LVIAHYGIAKPDVLRRPVELAAVIVHVDFQVPGYAAIPDIPTAFENASDAAAHGTGNARSEN